MGKEKKFEDMLDELENIVQSLENDDLKLDESDAQPSTTYLIYQ